MAGEVRKDCSPLDGGHKGPGRPLVWFVAWLGEPRLVPRGAEVAEGG